MLTKHRHLLRDQSLSLVLALLAIILLAGFLAVMQFVRHARLSGFVLINNHPVSIEVFDSANEREKGLSDRESLGSDKGALFIYPEPGQHAIWMKDMLIAIDVLWLDENGKVIHVVDDMSPDSYPQSYQSLLPARYVLELADTAINSFGIQIGTLVDNLPSPR